MLNLRRRFTLDVAHLSNAECLPVQLLIVSERQDHIDSNACIMRLPFVCSFLRQICFALCNDGVNSHFGTQFANEVSPCKG